MYSVKIADATLCREDRSFTFKEKLEIARQLSSLNVDYINLPEIVNIKEDTLLVKTMSSFVKDSIISVKAGSSKESVSLACDALEGISNSCVRIELPISAVNMEYMCHKKPEKMIEYIKELICSAKKKVDNVEFYAIDATRSEITFIEQVIKAAQECKVSSITICDTACELLPDDFASFIERIISMTNVKIGVSCNNVNSLACASSVMSVVKGASLVSTTIGGVLTPLEGFADMLRNIGANYGITSNIKYTELIRTIKQISRITDPKGDYQKSKSLVTIDDAQIRLDANDSKEDVIVAVKKLGYDLSPEDENAVYEEFTRGVEKTIIGAKELDAIVANSALQVPAVYKLVSYVINSGNVIKASAQIQIEKDGQQLSGISNGNGPIDAAFLAFDKIIGVTYELDDFQIKSINEGKEAMANAIVKLRSHKGVYSGSGISTDIIGASIRAYISAVNKIVYEEG